MNPAGYIGGEFCGADNAPFLSDCGDWARFFPERIGKAERALYETGSDALAAILRIRAPRRIWVPDNFCMDSLHRARAKLTVDLEIGSYPGFLPLDGLAAEGDAILFLHFNAPDPDTAGNALNVAKRAGAFLIEDHAHTPLDIAAHRGDYAFTSLRKFACLDVAVAYGGGLPQPDAGNESEYHMLKHAASVCKSGFYVDPDPEAEKRYLALYREAEISLARGTRLVAAHPAEIGLLGQLDFQAMRDARQRNFTRLSKRFSSIGVALVAGEYAYGMARFGNRDSVRGYFFSRGIFPAIHWADSGSAAGRELLSFHIDQRYSPAHMDRIADLMGDYISTVSSSP